MKHFAILTVALMACGLTACSHYDSNYDGYKYTDTAPKVITTSSSTSSVEKQCMGDDGLQMNEADCNTHIEEMKQNKAAILSPATGARVVTSGKTCKTVNGVTNCVTH